jgi:predicted glycogen debranching enzyme
MKYICFVGVIIWMISCKSDPLQYLPAISLVENENKQFTFTNKIAGFYIGNSHQQSENSNQGWTVNEFHYLRDYRIYVDEIMISRDSLQQFDYYPFAFTRNYNLPLKETFTLLDSINAIIWEFESSTNLQNFSFEPQLHLEIEEKNTLLTTSLSRLIFSPHELSHDTTEKEVNWMGFLYMPDGKNRVRVVSALETSRSRLNQMLDLLSKNFEDKKNERINRFVSLRNLNNTHTNIPEITEAVAWAQLSLDALITEQRGKGIWAGLPWFNNYWGRDSFISYAGALLVNGKFYEAREILESFSRFQLQNEKDTWDGRIPNRITNKEIIYNTADGTWWFVREAYEYLLYSGDKAFVKDIFPVIKRAIQGAIRNRIDENFFLIHDDADTWMDAKGPEGAWSPRGNRAIEIQSLWYTSLQIGSIFAGLSGEVQLKEHWMAISHTLREKFNRKYWSRVKNYAYDHLNEDGFPDRKIRPNQIFAVYVPRLPGIEPLLSEDKRARITSNVVHKLTYRYGVASLWQEDEDFHPWHLHPFYYHKDEAYHNGTVWSWLAGPVISSMLMFNHHELAFNLFYDEAIQILHDDAIGNFAELRDALPRNGKDEPLISGTISQAWSLAEFTRNFYQDFIGYQPNALQKRISFSPKIPGDLIYISTILPYQNTFISLTYSIEEDFYLFEFQLKDEENAVDVRFQFPGYDLVEFRLDGNNPSFDLSLNPANQKSYHLYQNLDWYFTQPELKDGLKTLQKTTAKAQRIN